MAEDQEARIKELEQELKIKELELKLDKKEDKLVTEDDWNWILIVFIVLAAFFVFAFIMNN